MDFSQLSHAEQARRLQGLAEEALGVFGLEGLPLQLLSHSAGTTFRVDAADGERFVLRVHPVGEGEALLRSEQDWLLWLRSNGLGVPEPAAAPDGRRLAAVSANQVPEPRFCQLARWVEGEPLESRLTPESCGQVGGFAGRLHDCAQRFEPPQGFVRPCWDCRGLAEQVPGEGFPLMSRPQRQLLRRAAGRIEEEVSGLGRDPSVFGIIHSDLQPRNILFHGGEVRAIDFADCGWGHYLFDIAACLLRFAGRPDYGDLRRSFLEGYRRVRELPEESESHLPALMAARGIYVAAWVERHWQSPSIREYGKEVVPYILGQARQYLGHCETEGLGEMSTVQFLSHLRGLGIDLQPAGGRLRFSAPKGVLDEALRSELAQRKAEILRLLHHRG